MSCCECGEPIDQILDEVVEVGMGYAHAECVTESEYPHD